MKNSTALDPLLIQKAYLQMHNFLLDLDAIFRLTHRLGYLKLLDPYQFMKGYTYRSCICVLAIPQIAIKSDVFKHYELRLTYWLNNEGKPAIHEIFFLAYYDGMYEWKKLTDMTIGYQSIYNTLDKVIEEQLEETMRIYPKPDFEQCQKTPLQNILP